MQKELLKIFLVTHTQTQIESQGPNIWIKVFSWYIEKPNKKKRGFEEKRNQEGENNLIRSVMNILREIEHIHKIIIVLYKKQYLGMKKCF